MSSAFGLASEPVILVVAGPDASRADADVRAGLVHEGFLVTAADGYAAAAGVLVELAPDLVVIDVAIADRSVIDFCHHLRIRSAVPLVVVADRSGEAETVLALEVGADEVVVRPCTHRELAARIRALLRRQQLHGASCLPDLELGEADEVVEVGDVRLDRRRHEVFLAGAKIHLPPKEYALLAVLLGRAGRVVTRDELIERVWSAEYVGDTKTLDAHIKRLRAKVERDSAVPERIVTVRGIGFLYEPVSGDQVRGSNEVSCHDPCSV